MSRNAYYRLKQQGLCVQCGDQPPREGRTRCQPCADYNAIADTQRREERAREGKCVRCAQRSTPGNRYCEPCMDGVRERSRRRLQMSRAKGLCYDCGEPCDREGIYCRACRDGRAEVQRQGRDDITKRSIRCGVCRRAGHNRRSCPRLAEMWERGAA